jgi:hypothetical protein
MNTEPKPLRWMTVPSPPEFELPEWRRMAAIGPDRTVYAPAAVVGCELKMLLAASWHGGIAVVERAGHQYLPVSWLAELSPGDADFLLTIAARVRQHFAKEPFP